MLEAAGVVRNQSGYIANSGNKDHGPLDFTGRIASGLRADLKRRAPFFASDWTDAFTAENVQQSLSTILYLFIAALAAAITCGVWSAGDDHVNGHQWCSFATFSGQPLSILGAAGPFLEYTLAVNDLSEAFDLEFMPFYFWTGMCVRSSQFCWLCSTFVR